MDQLLVDVFSGLHPALGQMTGVPLYVFLVVLALSSAFIVGYLLQGSRVGWQLWSVVRTLRRLSRLSKAPDPREVSRVFRKEPFRHLWEEYADTLHSVEKAASGSDTLIEVRATMPAEAFFTRQVLVESRMFDDFVRHLPGVLTGLGIIGTFAGLLAGLAQFDPTTTATAVAGLKPLLSGVAHAFIVSAIAISCAMVVVFVEKLVLALFNGKVEQLNQTIDGLYAMGAGEEYLARLTQSAEKSEVHAAHLKEALVEDLKQLLTNLTDRQIEAQQQSTQALGAQLSSAITQSLEKPMADIGEAVRRASSEQGTAVHGLLESVLTAFISRLEETFGGQMQGINESMERSMAAMAGVQTALQTLLQNIERSTETATTEMSRRLEQAMETATANQQRMTDQMREFVQEFRKLVTDEHTRSKDLLDQTMANVLTQLAAAMEQLKSERHAATTEESARQQQLKERTTELVGALAGEVDTLLKSIADQIDKTQRHIDAISAVSTRAIDGMNEGASTMSVAAQRFETAGVSISSVFDSSRAVSEDLRNTASSLQAAALVAKQGVELYDSARRTVDSHIATLSALVENAKSEAGLTKEMLVDLQRIVEQLRAAERQTEDYLTRVNEALVKGFSDFGQQLSNQVATTIKQTDTHLGKGVNHLTGVVQELGAALARLPRK